MFTFVLQQMIFVIKKKTLKLNEFFFIEIPGKIIQWLLRVQNGDNIPIRKSKKLQDNRNFTERKMKTVQRLICF